jgi:hypothetical protein
MVVTLLMFVILFACVAMLYNDGMWSNAIRLINVITAALLAMNFFEPLANWLEGQAPTYSYFCDFVALWGLFTVFALIFRLITDKVSQVKVKFLKMSDQIGSVVLALWIGWVMVGFTLTTLDVAPLARNALNGGLSSSTDDRMVLGMAPDRQWLAFTQKMSLETYARSGSEADKKKTMFDPHGEFLMKYATRRAALESNVQEKGALRASATGM